MPDVFSISQVNKRHKKEKKQIFTGFSPILPLERNKEEKWKRGRGEEKSGRKGALTSLADGDLSLVGLGLGRGVLSLARSSLGEVGLVALPLGVGQVVPLVVVEGEAELALIAATRLITSNDKEICSTRGMVRVRVWEEEVPAEVVPHEIGVLGEVDGLEGKPPETLPAVDRLVLGGGGTAAPRLRSPVSIHPFLHSPLRLPRPLAGAHCSIYNKILMTW